MAEPLPVVILIEDERQIRRFVRTALETEGWIVNEAETMRQGLTDAGTRKPDLIILDLNIPKISGYAVLASYPLKETPVVVFTASQNEADADRAFSLGAREFIHKPTDLDDYKTAVNGMVLKWTGHDNGRTQYMPL